MGFPGVAPYGIKGGAASSGLPTYIQTTLAAIRYYRMTAAVNSGTETDLGSQAANGTYSSTGISQVSPGLLPNDAGAGCKFTRTSSGKLTVPNTGGTLLPVGAHAFSYGLIAMKTGSNGFNIMQWNGCNFLWGTNAIQMNIAGGAGFSINGGGGDGALVFLVGTFNSGTNLLSFYINGQLVGSQVISAPNLTTQTACIGSDGASAFVDAIAQEAFWFDKDVSGNVATMWSKYLGH